MPTISDLVKNNSVNFSYYRNKVLFYIVEFNNETFQFPVPIEDVEGATLPYTEKAIFFMRWMRKAILNNELVKV